MVLFILITRFFCIHCPIFSAVIFCYIDLIIFKLYTCFITKIKKERIFKMTDTNLSTYKTQQTTVCTVMAFLVGAKEEYFEYYYSDNTELLNRIKNNQDCCVIRALCNIRSNLMINYQTTTNLIMYDLRNLDRQDIYKADIKILRENNLEIVKANYKVNSYIADINKLIADRINNVKDYFPEWFKWEYIKNLFVMPKGQKEENIIAESHKFCNNRGLYPYTRYINWNPKDEGNLLLNDEKFAKAIYKQYGVEFSDFSKVKDASESVKTSIYEFIDNSESLMLVVDCENSDAFKLASVLKQLDENETQKIQKIVLFDDVHTTNAWSFLGTITGIPVEHNVVERIKEDKSLVDIKIAMGISKAYYKDNISSFILLSSDSDFWGVISSLPDADFLVMAEKSKCGIDILNALENDGTYYCFIDDFCTGNIKNFKNAMLRSALEKEIGNIVNIDTKKLLEDIYFNLRMEVSEGEKQNFYNKYIKKMTLTIDNDGVMKIKIPE